MTSALFTVGARGRFGVWPVGTAGVGFTAVAGRPVAHMAPGATILDTTSVQGFDGTVGQVVGATGGGAPDHIGIKVALKDRLNALKNPYAHLHEPDITYESVRDSIMLWDPLRYSETCPSSDGACAMVLTDEDGGDAATDPAWMLGGAMRSEPTLAAGRDQVSPQGGRDCAADVYRQAGIADPRRDIDVAEAYVPFSWYEAMWLENLGFAEEGTGWRLVDEGATAFDGDIPWNPSGGVLSTNPIGASGMIRFAEAALQVRGQAGDHQIDGARVALGHAYGGGAQFFAMWAVGSEKP